MGSFDLGSATKYVTDLATQAVKRTEEAAASVVQGVGAVVESATRWVADPQPANATGFAATVVEGATAREVAQNQAAAKQMVFQTYGTSAPPARTADEVLFGKMGTSFYYPGGQKVWVGQDSSVDLTPKPLREQVTARRQAQADQYRAEAKQMRDNPPTLNPFENAWENLKDLPTHADNIGKYSRGVAEGVVGVVKLPYDLVTKPVEVAKGAVGFVSDTIEGTKAMIQDPKLISQTAAEFLKDPTNLGRITGSVVTARIIPEIPSMVSKKVSAAAREAPAVAEGWRFDPSRPQDMMVGRAPRGVPTIDVKATTVSEGAPLVRVPAPIYDAPPVRALAPKSLPPAAVGKPSWTPPADTQAPSSPQHLEQSTLFDQDVTRAVERGRLSPRTADVVHEHVNDLATRSPAYQAANTGNLRDLFNQTLERTKDPVAAFAQVVADSHKIIPLPPQTPLMPQFKDLATGERFGTVAALPLKNPVDAMLAAHTTVADPASRARLIEVIKDQHPELDAAGVERQLARTQLGMQHLPSSSFVMARASGLALDVEPLAIKAGFSPTEAAKIQTFFDTAGRFKPEWQPEFKNAGGPRDDDFAAWRSDYRQAYKGLPPELKTQLWTDTLTNFQPGTMGSGKWTSAVAKFEGAKTVPEVVEKTAGIVRQYQNEWTILHGRSLKFFNDVNAPVLEDFGITMDPRTGLARADLSLLTPDKRVVLQKQLDAALGTPAPAPPPTARSAVAIPE